MSINPAELAWLEKQTEPMWGGPIDRQGLPHNPSCMEMVEAGVIERVLRKPPHQSGYVITEKGRAVAREWRVAQQNRCKTCGQILPRATP